MDKGSSAWGDTGACTDDVPEVGDSTCEYTSAYVFDGWSRYNGERYQGPRLCVDFGTSIYHAATQTYEDSWTGGCLEGAGPPATSGADFGTAASGPAARASPRVRLVRVYFAAPLFTSGERMFNAELGARLRRAGHDVYLPQEQQAADDPGRIFRTDREHLDGSDVVVGIMDGADPDSGTSWEIGYAFATRRPIILLRTDLRTWNDTGAPYNLMLTESATERIDLAIPSVEEAAGAVLRVLARLEASS